MFSGNHIQKIDDRRRCRIPMPFYKQLSDCQIIIQKNLHGPKLNLYARSVFLELNENFLEEIRIDNEKLVEAFFKTLFLVELKSKEFILSQSALDHLKIEKGNKVEFIGLNKYIQVHSQQEQKNEFSRDEYLRYL